jgi:type II secretory pathway predicted ATPase ExeA
MYTTHFGLRERPFRAAPAAHAWYPASGHEAACAELQQGLDDGEGLLILTGEPGTGKTLLLHRLLEQQTSGRVPVLVTHCQLASRADLLKAVLFDLGLPYEGRGEQELRLALTDALLEGLKGGRPLLLACDEAHHLSPDLLEELRLLGNVETRSGKGLQVILAGQPTLLTTLQRPDLAAFRQRVTVRATLGAWSVEEAADFLLHQLRQAGGRAEALITEEALELLARGSGGVPRLLNQAAHQAFRLAALAESRRVDAEAALEALSALGLAPAEAEGMSDSAALKIAPPAQPAPVARTAGTPGGARSPVAGFAPPVTGRTVPMIFSGRS